MNPSRVRRFSFLVVAFAIAFAASTFPARAQERAPLLWFQGTRLILDRPVAQAGDIAVSTRDTGLRRFLDKLGATVAFEPQSRYVVVTAQDRRTIAFTIGDPWYTVAGVRVRAPFAPSNDGGDAVLPFFALARALYVEPVPDGGEMVLQPRVGALDVRTDGGRTVVTVRAAMPLLISTNADTPDRLQVTIVGQGSSLAPRRAVGAGVDALDVTAGGTARVPTTTITIAATPGTAHRIVAAETPAAFSVAFEPRGSVAQNVPPPPVPLGSAPPYDSGALAGPTAAPLVVAGRATVTGLTFEQGTDDALVVRVSLSGAAGYEWHRLLDRRWYLDLANTTLNGPGRDERPSFGAAQSVRVRQTGTGDAPAVRIAFTLAGDQAIDVQPSDTGLTITVSTAAATDVSRIGTGRTGGPPVAVSSASPDAVPSETPWKYGTAPNPRLIVLDPGHGGADAGTAHNGLTEKLLTLDIAKRLRTLLVAQGWIVRMTRENDVDPVGADQLAQMHADGKPNPDDRAYLQTRCDVANAANARMFISIHINSAPSSSARGSTFYWYKPQDAAFAQALERAVVGAAGTQDDGVRHENFYVVRHTTMPAVLIETAFVTNPSDVELLRSPSFLQNVAQGIANGVKAYAGAPAQRSVQSDNGVSPQ
ncbi:MAG: lytC [Candidatus Eremiobacteraeota bacterium]|nr:lytC [Candidatus Eremiobacteraeota bacterium]